jgi:hypothetical protein
VKPGLREIVFDEVSKAKIFASDAGTGDGIIPYPLEVIDELHRHKTLELYRTWAGKLDKEDAVLVVISTAGEPGLGVRGVREDMRQAATEVERRGLLRPVCRADVDAARVRGAGGRRRGGSRAREGGEPVVADHGGDVGGEAGAAVVVACALAAADVQHADAVGRAAITEREWFAALATERKRRIPAARAGLAGPRPRLEVRHDGAGAAVDPPTREFRLLGPATILEPPGDGSQLDAHLVEERALLDVHERNPIHTVVMDMTNGEQLSQWIAGGARREVVDRTQGNALACSTTPGSWRRCARAGCGTRAIRG